MMLFGKLLRKQLIWVRNEFEMTALKNVDIKFSALDNVSEITFFPLWRRFNHAEAVVEKSVIL